MAKSNLNLKSGQAAKLELDFFKLAFAVAALQTKGQEAIGYLQVLTPVACNRANGWCKKYETGNSIVILCSELTSEKQKLLEAEKKGNAGGIVPNLSAVQGVVNMSVASLGKDLGESALAVEILKRHPSVIRIPDFDKKNFPHGINWDFYGTT